MAAEKSHSIQKEPNWFSRYIPLFQWAPQYERGWLRKTSIQNNVNFIDF